MLMNYNDPNAIMADFAQGKPLLEYTMYEMSKRGVDRKTAEARATLKKKADDKRRKVIVNIVSIMREFMELGVSESAAAQLASAVYNDPDLKKITRITKEQIEKQKEIIERDPNYINATLYQNPNWY